MKNLLAGLGAIVALTTCGAYLDDNRCILAGIVGAVLVGFLISRANRRTA